MYSKNRTLLRKSNILIATALIMVPLLIALIRPVAGLELTMRSVRLRSSVPSAVTQHRFQFNVPSMQDIGAIQFEYCTNTPFIDDVCVAPNGLDVTSAALTNQTGAVNFVIDGATTANRLVITRAPEAVVPGSAQYVFDNVANPSTARQSVFVRISTYNGTDPSSDPRVDEGAVVFSTSGTFSTQGFVPPYLTFCVGITVSNSCTAVSGSYINLGTLSSAQTRSARSQFSAATNDPTGYSIYIEGTTLTAGNFIIPALSNPAPSQTGVSQYGINLRANSNPSVGSNRTGIGSAVVMPAYNTVNNYKFTPGDLIARSTLPTEFNVFTVSYITNVNGNQPPGRYSSTLTYVAVAAF
jgi:hypothetical protein